MSIMIGQKLRIGSAILLFLALASWVIALGGLGGINWLSCKDNENTVNDIINNFATNYPPGTPGAESAAEMQQRLLIPDSSSPAATDVTTCSRSWRWEWFTLFFTFAVIIAALIVTALPSRLLRARYPLAVLLSIATTLIMIAVNQNIATVWFFSDTHERFHQWTGVLRYLYLSWAALVAGWILLLIFNIAWIAFILGTVNTGHGAANAPLTGDLESAGRK